MTKKSVIGGLLLAALLAVGLTMTGCSSPYPRRDPTGELFPTVQGESLDGTVVELPTVGAGAPMLLLVGYVQNAQFDLDRWLLGLDQVGASVRAYEVPTIRGMVPGMISGTIDNGMRRGIPSEDWAAVVTVYDDADRIAEFTGDENSNNGRILLLDAEGKVAFFHDRGYSVGSLNALRDALGGLGR